MGVRHLISFLHPYATKDPISNRVVIDGPGFAYHVYYLSLNKASTNPFDATPSYRQLAENALAWLDTLRCAGVNIKKIIFDGFLPASKAETRSQRLIDSTNKLSKYYQTCPGSIRSNRQLRCEDEAFLFSGPSVPSRLTAIPALPFLVPAILEALCISNEYKHLVEVVPGEADSYCARLVNSNGGIILTGDSDLLVHDLGADGAVVFFKDLQVSSEPAGGMSGLVFKPSDIAERLSLCDPVGLLHLAFEMSLDPNITFRKAVDKAKSLASAIAHPKDFEKFSQEYMPLSIGQGYQHRDTPGIDSVLKLLDPRISEVVLQYPRFALLARLPLEEVLASPHVFLPVLLDSPIRTNAWEISASVRQLAYGLLNFVVPDGEHKPTVFEHRRQQEKAGGREMQLPVTSELPEACAAFLEIDAQIEARLPGLSELKHWTALAVHQEMAWSHLNSKISLAEATIRGLISAKNKIEVVEGLSKQARLKNGSSAIENVVSEIGQLEKVENPTDELSWDATHFLAQIQGSYYSCRLLKQIIELVVVSHIPGKPLPEIIFKLHRRLQALPSLQEYPSFRDSWSFLTDINRLGMVEASKDILGIVEPKITEPAKEKKISKKKRKRDRSSTKAPENSKKSSNPFDLLAVE